MTDCTQALIDQVKNAIVDKKSLNICAGNSKTHLGRESSGDILDVSKHRGIVSYQPVELVLTASAGTPLQEIQDTLAEHNQILSFDPPLFDGKATLGGTLACNQSGPGRPWLSSIRDMVLGIRLINGKAEHLRFGGQVMKNVAGYDVSRAQAGAMGTLGIITEISLKVLPRLEATSTLVQEMSADDAIVQMNKLSALPKPLTGAFWNEGLLFLRLSGTQSAVAATIQQWGGELLSPDNTVWEDLREHRLEFFSGSTPLWRLSTKSTAAHESDDQAWLIDWAGSQRWLRSQQDRNSIDALANRLSGQATLYRSDDRQFEAFAPQSPALQQLHLRLKNAFDPDNIFNPGRLYSWM